MNARRMRLTASGVAGAYIGTVVGAGFASGQETLRFFGLHGRQGFWGLLASAALFAVYGAIVLELGRRLQANSHRPVVQAVAGRFWATAMDAVITCSLLSSVGVMAAGAGASLHELVGWPSGVGAALMVAASVATVLVGIQGVLKALRLVTPFMLCGILLLSASVLRLYEMNWDWSCPELAANRSWSVSALAYVSYNISMAMAVLAPIGALGDAATLRRGAVLGGLGLGAGGIAVYLALRTHVPVAAMQEVPMLFIVRQVMRQAPWVYTALLWAQIYTTAIASLYGFSARLVDPARPAYRMVVIAAGVAAFLASTFGFARLVQSLYTAMGYVGFGFLFALTIWAARNMRSH